MLTNTNAANLADPNDLLGLGITTLVPDDQLDESSVVRIADSNLQSAVDGSRRELADLHTLIFAC